MTPRIDIWTLFLLAVMLISACAPVATPSSAPPEAPPAATELQPSPIATVAQPTSNPGTGQAVETAAQPPVPLATSRGDALEATNPSTVVLANGGIQLIEFFRFT